jgi:hypothetical protein
MVNETSGHADASTEPDFWDFLPPHRALAMREACSRAELAESEQPETGRVLGCYSYPDFLL